MRVGSLASSFGLACLLTALAVRAEPAEDASSDRTARARELFVSGTAQAREGRWTVALESFEQSAALVPHAVTSYNIGYCERALGHSTRARAAFLQALDQGAETKLEPDVLADLRRYLAEAESRIAHLELRLLSPATALSIDERPPEKRAQGRFVAGVREPGDPERVPTELDVDVDPGRHVILVSDLGRRTRRVPFQVGPGARIHLDLTVPLEPKAKKRDTPKGLGTERGFAYGMAGVGVVGLGIGGYLAWRAKSTHDDATAACADRAHCPDDRAHDLSLDARRYGNLATITVIGAVSALAGATVLYIDSMQSEGAHGVVVGGRF